MSHLTLPASTPAPSATTEQNQALRDDVAQVLALRTWINQQTGQAFDSSRVIAVTAASPGGEQYLPYTIPTLIRQIARTGKRADIVIGLNNGYECPHTIADLATLVDTEMIHLYTGEKPGANIPAPIFTSPERRGAGYSIAQTSSQHRIFVLHQQRGPHAAGKIRILGDICHALLLDNIAQGWIPPAYLLMFDQETLVLEDRDDYDLLAGIEKIQHMLAQGIAVEGVVQRVIADHYAASRQQSSARPIAAPTVDLNGRGADKLIERLEQSAADIVSVRWKNCVYNVETFYRSAKVVLPNLNLDSSILHRVVYALTGLTPHTMTFSGGCTLGKIDALLAIHAWMYSTYPGLIGEDALSTVLAYHAGCSAIVERSLYNTNRCPTAQETTGTPPVSAWKEQYARWIAGNEAIERLYGYSNITPIQGIDEQMSGVIGLAIFAKTLYQTNDVAKGLAVLHEMQAAQAEFEDIKQLAQKKRYVYKGDYTQASWW